MVACPFKVRSQFYWYCMPKLYLLGGENVFKRSAKEVNDKAFHDEANLRLLRCFLGEEYPSIEDFVKGRFFTDYFISLGVGTINFLEYLDSNGAIAEKDR